MRADGGGRGLDLLPRGAGVAELDVVEHGAGEQEVLLGDRHDGAPEISLAEVAFVDAVEQHAPFARVPNLAASRAIVVLPALCADERHGLPCGDLEVEMVQHDAVAVAEAHAFEPQFAERCGSGVGSTGSRTLGASSSTPDSFSSEAAAAWNRL